MCTKFEQDQKIVIVSQLSTKVGTNLIVLPFYFHNDNHIVLKPSCEPMVIYVPKAVHVYILGNTCDFQKRKQDAMKLGENSSNYTASNMGCHLL